MHRYESRLAAILDRLLSIPEWSRYPVMFWDDPRINWLVMDVKLLISNVSYPCYVMFYGRRHRKNERNNQTRDLETAKLEWITEHNLPVLTMKRQTGPTRMEVELLRFIRNQQKGVT
jgi:hypothetical protein